MEFLKVILIILAVTAIIAAFVLEEIKEQKIRNQDKAFFTELKQRIVFRERR